MIKTVKHQVHHAQRARIIKCPMADWPQMIGTLVACADRSWFFPERFPFGVEIFDTEGWEFSTDLAPLSSEIGTTPEPPIAAPEPPPRRSREVYDGEAFAKDLDEALGELRELLIKKNTAYGDSALNPVRIFSKSGAMEQLFVRIDDKLSRLKRGEAAGEDVLADLCGYLVLVRIAEMRGA